MKQKIVLIFLAAALSASLTACGNKADEYYESGLSYLYGTDEKKLIMRKLIPILKRQKNQGKPKLISI